MVNIAIIGAGRIAKIHAKNLSELPDVKLTYINDIEKSRTAYFSEKYGMIPMDLVDILASGDVDSVFICTHTDSHCDLSIEFIKKKISVFCEKPIAISIEEAMLIQKAVSDHSVLFQIGFQRRFDDIFLEIKNKIKKGEIGDIEYISIISRDPRPASEEYIKNSPSIFIDMMTHDFDMAKWLLPEKFVKLYAVGSCISEKIYGKYDDCDTALVMIISEKGQIITIQNSRFTAGNGYDQRIEVKGSRGVLKANNPKDFIDNFSDRYQKAFKQSAVRFVELVREKKSQSDLSVDVGLESLKLCLFADQSWRKKIVLDIDV